MLKNIIALLVVVFGVSAFAQDVVEVPSWVAGVMIFIQQIPYVGPIVLEVVKWLGLVAGILTAISAFLIALQKVFSAMEKVAFIGAAFAKAVEFIEKILPYVKYLSMFNVAPKPAPVEEKK